MAFYTEFKNLTTGLYVSDITEFASAAVGTKFQRINGLIYVKNSSGLFDVDEAIPNLKIYDINNNIIFP
jgi:hypothetical protein